MLQFISILLTGFYWQRLDLAGLNLRCGVCICEFFRLKAEQIGARRCLNVKRIVLLIPLLEVHPCKKAC